MEQPGLTCPRQDISLERRLERNGAWCDIALLDMRRQGGLAALEAPGTRSIFQLLTFVLV